MQPSFSDLEHANRKNRTRRDRFPASIEAGTPRTALVAEIEGASPKRGGHGKQAVGFEPMLRMDPAQQCVGLCDEGIENALYASHSIRRFVGINLAHESTLDASTLRKICGMRDEHQLIERIFEAIKGSLAENGPLLREGKIVDATLIAAPVSSKNAERACKPEVHRAKGVEQRHFGTKAYFGVAADSGLTHTMVAAAVNVKTSPRCR